MNILYHCQEPALHNPDILTGFFCVELVQRDGKRGLMGVEYTEEFNEKMKEFK